MKTLKSRSKKTPLRNLFILILTIASIIGCSKDETIPTPGPVQQQNPEPEPESELVLSSDKQMTGFRFAGLEINGVTVDIPGEIDEEAKTIAIEMPSGTKITALEPEVETPDNAVYEPTGPQDFSTPINYTVTAEDGTSRTYLVTVALALSQKEILLIIYDANPGNTLNWNETDNLSDWTGVTLDGVGNITRLALAESQLTTIPSEIGQLGRLERLGLSFNSLSSLPPEIGQLNSLNRLNLLSNDLSSLPPEIGQLGNLEILFLGDNDLSSLPPEIGQLGNLLNLDLSGNNLASLSPEIGQLGRLEGLGLSANNLVSLPAEIGQLNSLLGLNLRGNELSSLPIEMNQLVNLSFLDLRENKLSAFNDVAFIPSDGFGDITPAAGCATETNLETLLLSGNPDLKDLNQCVCDLDLDKGGTVDIDVVPDGINCVANDVISD